MNFVLCETQSLTLKITLIVKCISILKGNLSGFCANCIGNLGRYDMHIYITGESNNNDRTVKKDRLSIILSEMPLRGVGDP